MRRRLAQWKSNTSRRGKIQRDFLWGGGSLERKAHLIKWKVVCSPKEEGGLGIRKIDVLNKALLGKWVWRYAYEKENLWKRVIGVKYGQEGCGWRTKDVCGPYGVGLWKEIMKEADWCWESIVFKVGKGTRILFWMDKWCGNEALSQIFPQLFTLAGHRNAKVSEVWDSSWVKEDFRTSTEEDAVRWKRESNGVFGAKGAYKILVGSSAVSSRTDAFGWIRCQQKYLFLLGKLRGGRSSPWISFKEGGGSSLTGVFCVDVKRKCESYYVTLYSVGGDLLWGKKEKTPGIPFRCAFFGRFGRKGIGCTLVRIPILFRLFGVACGHLRVGEFPRYLSFVKGVVDSDDLPLNVSREILQESRIVRIMRKRLVRKTFDMIQEVSESENKEDYKKILGELWKVSKVRMHRGHWESQAHNTTIKAIYYLATDSLKSAKTAPFLEKLVQKDIEVLYLIEPIDEVAIQNLQTYKEKKFVDISKEDLELGDDDEVKERETKQEYNLLCDWIKQQLGDKVAKVQVSKRLSSSPCVLVSGKFGWSANMERLMKAQALGDTSSLEFMRGRRILEINPDHPIIKDLNAACKLEPDSSEARRAVDLLYDTALISSGFSPDSPAELGNKIYEMMSMALGGRWGRAEGEGEEEEEEKEAEVVQEDATESETQVIEPSEVRAESDPWND
ncbi:Heat shock protein 90-5, chloroplastic [Vitis vinifera]|uniref:Heat shock protein 90-5, chloroplastic n=1 Tax=Vitis vinifera TaxID=29760 RepID=A0A438EA00_VITVI|nr:Heat shock protein 90-5, chloroplastic [Vitis vinifera]